MVFFDKKLVSATLHNGKLYAAGNNISNKYMDDVPTQLLVKAKTGSMSFGIRCLTQFSTCSSVNVDWGDGNQEIFEFGEAGKVDSIVHEYTEPGQYVVQISNTVAQMQVSQTANGGNNPGALIKVLRLGTNVGEIGESCFEGAVNLDEVRFESSRVSALADYAFNGSGISSINIPSTVCRVGNEAFAECKNLKSITVEGSSLTAFGNDCCKGDYSLQHVDMPAGVQSYATCPFGDSAAVTSAFIACKYGLDADMPEGWTDIPANAFAGMPLLTAAAIPSTVKTIHEGAFSDIDKTVQVEEGEELVDYSPLFNGLKQLTFNADIGAISCFNSTMRKTFSETYDVNDVASKCYDDEVKDAVASCLSPSIELSFANASKEYSYWKGVCSNKMYGEVLSALTKYTDFCNGAAQSCQYAITQNEHFDCADELWGDIEQFYNTRYTVYQTDSDSLRNSNEFVLSDLKYDLLPTIAYINDPDAPGCIKTMIINNGKVFTADDLKGLQQYVTEIHFGKYSTLSIADDALAGCTHLKKVKIPATVTYIGKRAFADLSELQDVIFKRSRSVFVDEQAFSNTTALTSFTSEYDNIDINGAQFMQLAEDASLSSFSNSKLDSSINFADAASVNSTFAKSSVLRLSYPKATYFDEADKAFYSARNLELIAVPQIERFNTEKAFYGRSNIIDKTLSIDMHERTSDDIPSLNPEFLRTSSAAKLTKFSAVVPYDMYGDWCVDEDWDQYHGAFVAIYDNARALDEYVALDYCSRLPEMPLTSTIDYGHVQVQSNILHGNTDKITQITFKTAPTGQMPTFENFKLIAHTNAGVILSESQTIKYDGGHDQIINFKFEKPIPVNGEQEIIIQLKNNEADAMLRIYAVKVDGIDRPALDVHAIDTPKIENPQAILFQQYAYDDTTIILTKRVENGTSLWMIDGKVFEPTYGKIINDNGADCIIFKYIRGQITPYSIGNMTNIKFTDGTQVFFDAENGILTRKAIADAIPAGKSISFIKVGNSVQEIEENAFQYLKNIGTFILPAAFKKLDDPYAFAQCINLRDIYLGENITDIALYLFYDCKSLRSVYLPYSVSCLNDGGHQFDGSGVKDISLPYNVKSIPSCAFINCKELTSISLSPVSALNDSAFAGCQSLARIDIPSTVEFIGRHVFKDCTALSAVNMQKLNAVPDLDDDNILPFYNNPAALSLNVNDAMYDSFCDAEGWCDLSAKIFASEEYMDSLCHVGSTVIRGSRITQAAVSCAASPVSVDTRSNITKVDISAFARNESISSVIIGANVSEIADYAFARCPNLKNVKILAGNELTLKPHAFDYCYELSSLEIDADRQIIGFGDGKFNTSKILSIELPDITEIGAGMFEDCYYLQDVVLPDSLRTIGSNAFTNNIRLSNINNMNDNITSFGNAAFYNCQMLTTLHMPLALESIGINTFANSNIDTFDFSQFDHIPTLANSNAFSVVKVSSYKIIVPKSLSASWTAAYKWSDISSHIVGK